MLEPGHPEEFRQAAEKGNFTFSDADQLTHFVEVAYTDGEFWSGVGQPESPIKYPEIRQAAIKSLAEEFSHQGFSEEVIKSWTEEALSAARDLYAQAKMWSNETKMDGLPHPVYHGTNTGQGHIEMVMSNALMTLLALKRSAKNYGHLSVPERKFLDENYGGQTGIETITPADLKKLIAYTAFHETGEWWPRMVPYSHLGEYRRSLEGKLNAFFQTDPDNNLKIGDWNTKIREEIKDNLGTILEYKLVEGELLNIAEDLPLTGGAFVEANGKRFWVEMGFGLTLGSDYHEKDTSFNSPLTRKAVDQEDQKRIALARITRAADLAQCYDANYQRQVTVGDKKTTLGAALLYAEFTKYMPHALPSFHWTNGILSAGISSFLVETVVENWNLPPTLVGLLDRFGPNQLFPNEKDIYATQHGKLRQIALLN